MKRGDEREPIRVPEPALERDVAAIARLLESAAPETIPLSEREVRVALERFSVVRASDGTVIAVAALYPTGDGRTELRSVAVDAGWRGRGLGRTLVGRLLEQVASAGCELFCFTFRPGFFANLGFAPVCASTLPRREGRPASLRGRPRRAMAAPAAEVVT